jgi:molecular chaperone DnaK (HSP70)
MIHAVREDDPEWTDETLVQVAVGVPAYFTPAQRQLVVQAAMDAGATKAITVMEPTAAAVDSQLDGTAQNDDIAMVFDWGGGTFDVTLLQTSVSDGVHTLRVIGTDGDPRLGGRDVDVALARVLRAQHPSTVTKQVMQSAPFMEAVRRAKETSCTQGISVPLQLAPDVTEHITQERVQAAAETLLRKNIQRCIGRVLSHAGLRPQEVDHVIMTGGSCGLPGVHAFLHKAMPNAGINTAAVAPATAVAAGAARMAAATWGVTHDLQVLEVVPHDMRVQLGRDDTAVIINRNTPIPCERTFQGKPANPGDPFIDVNLLCGNHPLASQCESVAQVRLPVPPHIRVGAECRVDIVVHVDTECVVTMHAAAPGNVSADATAELAPAAEAAAAAQHTAEDVAVQERISSLRQRALDTESLMVEVLLRLPPHLMAQSAAHFAPDVVGEPDVVASHAVRGAVVTLMQDAHAVLCNGSATEEQVRRAHDTLHQAAQRLNHAVRDNPTRQ